MRVHDLAERGLLPDALVRLGVRRQLRKRLREQAALPDAVRGVAASFQHIDDVPRLELPSGIAQVLAGGVGAALSPADGAAVEGSGEAAASAGVSSVYPRLL